jgi:hypothetical protein
LQIPWSGHTYPCFEIKKTKETELNNFHVPSSLPRDDLANFLTYKEDEEEE